MSTQSSSKSANTYKKQQEMYQTLFAEFKQQNEERKRSYMLKQESYTQIVTSLAECNISMLDTKLVGNVISSFERPPQKTVTINTNPGQSQQRSAIWILYQQEEVDEWVLYQQEVEEVEEILSSMYAQTLKKFLKENILEPLFDGDIIEDIAYADYRDFNKLIIVDGVPQDFWHGFFTSSDYPVLPPEISIPYFSINEFQDISPFGHSLHWLSMGAYRETLLANLTYTTLDVKELNEYGTIREIDDSFGMIQTHCEIEGKRRYFFFDPYDINEEYQPLGWELLGRYSQDIIEEVIEAAKKLLQSVDKLAFEYLTESNLDSYIHEIDHYFLADDAPDYYTVRGGVKKDAEAGYLPVYFGWVKYY